MFCRRVLDNLTLWDKVESMSEANRPSITSLTLVLPPLFVTMMKALLTLSLLLLAQLSHADQGAIEVAKAHISSNLSSDHKKLVETYAQKLTLMSGHEYLKEKYGLAGDGARATGAEVEGSKLIKAMVKSSADKPTLPMEHAKRILDKLKYESIEVHEGDFTTDASDTVKTPDGKLHFMIKKGDVLIKASAPKADFVLLQLRVEEGSWRVVSEYLD